MQFAVTARKWGQIAKECSSGKLKKINPCIWVHKLQEDESKNKAYILFNITRINEALSPART